jgi:hypothetical protein
LFEIHGQPHVVSAGAGQGGDMLAPVPGGQMPFVHDIRLREPPAKITATAEREAFEKQL